MYAARIEILPVQRAVLTMYGCDIACFAEIRIHEQYSNKDSNNSSPSSPSIFILLGLPGRISPAIAKRMFEVYQLGSQHAIRCAVGLEFGESVKNRTSQVAWYIWRPGSDWDEGEDSRTLSVEKLGMAGVLLLEPSDVLPTLVHETLPITAEDERYIHYASQTSSHRASFIETNLDMQAEHNFN